MNRYLTRWAALMAYALLTLIPAIVQASGGSFAKIEASFELPRLQGNPFDFTQNDVQVTLMSPDGAELKLPAFFDGGQVWRVRHTPSLPGKYTIGSITLNGKDAEPQRLSQRDFIAGGSPGPGFIRIDPTNKMRFAFDTGPVYYPVGYNLAWHQNGSAPMPPLQESLARMGKAGVNWTRIWMNYWDGKNLDWSPAGRDQPALGQLDLSVAKNWDSIVDAAETNGVYFQMTLQHHGQYTTRADANWQLNPWNKARGGWLDNPAQFFSDPRAIALTKAKCRYIVARWGYSASIMAWELFNEVESTDGFRTNKSDVASWHAEMAAFLRHSDLYKHLITTSSHTNEPTLWTATDYYQSHSYPSDILSAIANLDAEHLPRPYFFGEFGGPNSNAQANSAEVIHRGLWGSLMSGESGAAQYWFWYEVEPRNLLFHYTAAQKFIALSAFPGWSNSRPIEVEAETDARGPLKFGPGLDWAPSKQTRFILSPSGRIDGVGGMSAFLQGPGGNHDLFPSATFDVDYPSAGTFAVHADQVTSKGARLELSVDGRPASSLSLGDAPANSGRTTAGNVRINVTLAVPVPAGKHVIRMENTGGDWIHIRDFTLTPYTSALGVLGKGNGESAILWIYQRDQEDVNPVAGHISIPGLASAQYRIVWWDTYKGEILKEETGSVTGSNPLRITTPAISRDAAVFIQRADEKTGP